jgi:hypothetical protein
MKTALIYSSKVWLTTIFVGPLIMGVKIYSFYYGRDEDAWKCLYLVPEIGILYGILYFLTSWFILSRLCWYISKRNLINKRTKVYLSFIGLVLAIAPFAVMDYHSLFTINKGWFAGFPPDLFWTITYVGLTVAGIWFYKLEPVNNSPKTIETSPK